jgi:hypothetical protein
VCSLLRLGFGLIFSARKLWRDYFAAGVDGVVFLIDAVDRERFPEAKRELDVTLRLLLLGTHFVSGSLDLRGTRQCSFPHSRK